MKLDVAERLITNIESDVIEHDQMTWLQNGSDVFVISNAKRWTCATSGCAAGFLFLAEAPEGSVFDTDSAYVFNSVEDFKASAEDGADLDDFGTDIVQWGADTLGIGFYDAYNLFYDFGDTEDIVRKIRKLMEEYSS